MNHGRILNLTFIATIIAGVFLFGTQNVAKAQENAEVNQQLAPVRAATARYHDINVALADGFAPADGTCIDTADGTHGIGYVNVPRFVSPDIDLLEPEILNYIPTADGSLRLISVVYTNRVMFRDTRPPNTPGYRPGIFPLQQPMVPSYFEEVSGTFSLFGRQPERLFSGRWIYLLSAWVWSPNPSGMFAAVNPRLNCTTN